MNYYDRIQLAIDYIELHLTHELNLENVATSAFMSSSHFYRLFHALVGDTVKSYVRLRRISESAIILKVTDRRILDISFDFQFQSQEAFTRAFKKAVGTTPAEYRKSTYYFEYGRMDLMDKYFEIQDKGLLESYPEIKVLKELSPRKVAYYVAYSETPEDDAMKILLPWAKKNHLLDGAPNRIFGFNNPNPSKGSKIYGYEFQITVGDDFVSNDMKIKTKEMPGGLYAVMSTHVSDIVNAWQRFSKWLEISKYCYGDHQWMEEHLSLEGDFKIDLYLPIKD